MVVECARRKGILVKTIAPGHALVSPPFRGDLVEAYALSHCDVAQVFAIAELAGTGLGYRDADAIHPCGVDFLRRNVARVHERAPHLTGWRRDMDIAILLPQPL